LHLFSSSQERCRCLARVGGWPDCLGDATGDLACGLCPSGEHLGEIRARSRIRNCDAELRELLLNAKRPRHEMTERRLDADAPECGRLRAHVVEPGEEARRLVDDGHDGSRIGAIRHHRGRARRVHDIGGDLTDEDGNDDDDGRQGSEATLGPARHL
jgi:hypothetical protein